MPNRAWEKRNWALALSVTTLLLSIAFLLFNNLRTQDRLYAVGQERMQQRAENLASTLGYFLSERQDDIRDITVSRQIDNYFANLALGMSLEYGLQINVDAINRFFNALLTEKQLEGTAIYERLALLDADGGLVVDASTEEDAADLPSPGGAGQRTAQMRAIGGGRIVISMPIYRSERYTGRVLAVVNADSAYQHLLVSGQYDPGQVVCVQMHHGDLLFSEALTGLACRDSLDQISDIKRIVPIQTANKQGNGNCPGRCLGLRLPVPGAPMDLTLLVEQAQLVGDAISDKILLVAGALAVFLILITGLVIRANLRNTVLQARYEEAGRQQRQLEEKNRDLAEEIRLRELTEIKLIEARESAEAANIAKTQFLANMSHELRTPLNGIMGMNHILSRSGLNERQQRHSRIIQDCANNLLALVEDLLEFSCLEAGQFKLRAEPFDTQSLLANLTASHQNAASKKYLTLTRHLDPAIPARLVGDADRIRQIGNNLLNNAIKFTDQGQVVFRAWYSFEAEPGLHLQVEDTGIGIAPADRPKIFEKFNQADNSTTRAHQGVGLGLAIVADLLKLMQGRIEVEDKAGPGTLFHVFLPLPIAAEAADAQKGIAPPNETTEFESPNLLPALPPDYRVLIVEDNAQNRQVLSEFLQPLGGELLFADNGREAFEQWRDHRPSLIFMDCQMPVMDGFAASRRIREAEGTTEHVPIIALTARVLDDDRKQCFSAGMDDFLAKPYTEEQLHAVLLRWQG